MKKLLICILITSAIACKKNGSSLPASATINITTEAGPAPKLATSSSCMISAGQGSWSGHRVWQIIFSEGANSLTVIFKGDFPSDQIPTNTTLSYGFRKGNVHPDLSILYDENGVQNHIGSDSCFLNISISNYDGHHVSGNFSFNSYDPGLWAEASGGQFANIPVTIQ